MKEIEADNKILPIKHNLNKVNNEIDNSKSKLNDLEYLNNLLSVIKNKMENHISMINSSVKSKSVDYALSSMNDKNSSNYSKVITSIENDRTYTKKQLKKLYDEQDKLIKKMREENNKNDDKQNTETIDQNDDNVQ